MKEEYVYISCLLILVAIDFSRGVYKNRNFISLQNSGVNMLGNLGLVASRPLMAFLVGGALSFLFPGNAGFLLEVNTIAIFIVFILLEDYLHYWLHRISHVYGWLWKIHRVHHEPTTIDATVCGRNAFIWWCIAPAALLGSIFVWGGMGEVVAIAAGIKGVVGLMAHTNFRWDLRLLHNPLTRPFMKVYSRIISVPDTHHYHHDLEGGDKNYGVLFIFWDTMHGTAVIPEKRMERFGLYNPDEVDPWYVQIFQPFLFQRKRPLENSPQEKIVEAQQ